MGVDEAGKGPVLGSMFVAAVDYDVSVDVDVVDSKQMTPGERTEAAGVLRDSCRYSVVEVSAAEVDDHVSGVGSSMNDLVVEAHAEALDRLDADGVAVVDASDTDEARFGRRVEVALEAAVDVDARHKADEDYPAVAAASVVAKVERDRHVAEISERYGRDVGSGYPSDPVTREFLRSYVDDEGGLPPEARSSWSTSEDVLKKAEQSALEEF